MKEGTGGDPFADEPEESIDEQGTPTVEGVDSGNSGGPGWRAKESAKARRDMVQFFLQESTKDREDEFLDDVEDAAGFDVYLTDVREAAYLVAMEHSDEVAEKLEEWGCEYA